MTIDILRSANPALSLSSYTEDAPTDSHLYGKPTPLDLTIANQALSSSDAESASRSKSAPPTDPPTEKDNSADAQLLETIRGYSYEVKRNSEPLRHGLTSSSSGSSGSPDSLSENPDEDPEVEKRVFAVFSAPPAAVVAHTNNGGSQRETDRNNNNSNSSNSNITKLQVGFHSPEDHQTGSFPSYSPGRQSSSRESTEGVLVLRPNPVKTVPPISSKGMAGVVAPTPIISTAPFVPNSPKPVRPIALSPRQEGASQAKSVERTAVVEPTKAEQEAKLAWCKQATAADQIERKKKERAKEKKKQAELRRLQELQCNFPNSYSNMPPTSGRASAEAESNADENAGQNRQTEQTSVNRPQHNAAIRMSTTRASSGGSILPQHNNRRESEEAGGRNVQSTPVFERLVTDEVRELQVYARMVENQNVELDSMRLVQRDLEKRLLDESRKNEQLEATLEAREREWLVRFEELERDIKRLGSVVRGEENKNKLLVDQIRKKDQDIQGMLKKKYDHEAANSRSVRNFRGPERDRPVVSSSNAFSKSPEANAHTDPHKYLRDLGSAGEVRERNTRHLLMDFFGL